MKGGAQLFGKKTEYECLGSKQMCHDVDHGVLQDGSASRWKSLLDKAKLIGLEGKLRGHKIQSTLKSINTMVETMQTTVESGIKR